MRNFINVKEENFFRLPKSFNKYSDMEILKYAVGANLYMNGLMDIYIKIKEKTLGNCTTVTICFEDAISENKVPLAEKEFIESLVMLSSDIEHGEIDYNDIPLIFIRVRNNKQFKNLTGKLNCDIARLITGFIFPKFTLENGEDYLEHSLYISDKLNEKFYVMPILESKNIIYKESRINALIGIKELLNNYKDIVLNIRVGGTDFSSKFGLRRTVSSTIYDIRVVVDCLIDIVNIFSREEEDYVVSAAVWEYFSKDSNSKEVQGLINEVRLDKENGFIGKTVIHPYQVEHVNLNYLVTYEEYMDATKILKNENEGGVFKGYGDNKMNEISPHINWARKTLRKSEVFGVGKCNEIIESSSDLSVLENKGILI